MQTKQTRDDKRDGNRLLGLEESNKPRAGNNRIPSNLVLPVYEKNTPPEKRTRGKTSFQSTVLGAREPFPPQDLMGLADKDSFHPDIVLKRPSGFVRLPARSLQRRCGESRRRRINLKDTPVSRSETPSSKNPRVEEFAGFPLSGVISPLETKKSARVELPDFRTLSSVNCAQTNPGS